LRTILNYLLASKQEPVLVSHARLALWERSAKLNTVRSSRAAGIVAARIIPDPASSGASAILSALSRQTKNLLQAPTKGEAPPSREGLLPHPQISSADCRYYGRQFAGRCLANSVALPAAEPVAIVKPAGIAWSPHCQDTSLFTLVQGVSVMVKPLITVACLP